MFEFRYVELMNWAYWPTVKLPLDARTIMITGPNGSGKTTFLDALRTLLRAPRLSANRRFTDYLIGSVDTAVVKALVTNDYHQRERRPFEFKGFAADLVTLAVIMRKRSGQWERRYLIAEGDVPLTDLQKVPKSHLLTPETFTFELGEAGFTASFLKVLALEQGQTDKLCEKSPRELLDLLLDVHGDKQVIERYKLARENYHRANLEVTQLGARLAEEQAKVLASERAASEAKRHAKLVAEQRAYEDVLIPQAEYQHARAQIADTKLQIDDLTMNLGPLDRGVLSLQESLQNADSDLDRRRLEVEKCHELRRQMDTQERDLDIKLSALVAERRQLEELLKLASAADRADLDTLFETRAKLRREMVRLELRTEELNRALAAIQQDVLGLEVQQRKVYPRYVEDFVRVLEHAGVEHDLLCDVIDIKEREWQLAIESILGRDRFTVLVEPPDQLQARQLGEKHGYRCYISAREDGRAAAGKDKPPRGAAIGKVEFHDDVVPRWIVDNLARTLLVEDVQAGMKAPPGSVSVTRQGYRQDQRGGIAIAVDRFYCGRLGQSSLKDDLGREVNDLKSQLGQVQKELRARQAEEEQLQQQIKAHESLDRIQEAHSRLKHLAGEVPQFNEQHQQALVLKRQAEDKLLQSLETLSSFERDCSDMRKDLLSQRGVQTERLTELQELQSRLASLQEQVTQIAAKLEPKHLTETALGQVEDLDELTPKYYTVQRLLAEFEAVPPEGAVEVYEHHRAQYDKQRQLYEEHEQGLRQWEQEFQLARQKYVVVVEHTIREYRRNVLALAELAGVAAEVSLPDLSQADHRIEEAELQVRFGFDGKRPTGMAASSLSGGQRVVASLVLLMSLTTSGGINRGGFFIIDEPFAHLSIERIDDVTRFLDSSHCQFILTSPTTHNVNVFSAARLQLNFRVKPPALRRAPVPTVIRR